MNTRLEKYIRKNKYAISEAAREIGVSRQLLHYAMQGQPVSRKTALKIEKWSDGFVPAVDLLIGVREPELE